MAKFIEGGGVPTRFLYFSFGSNMSSQRIRNGNPSAIAVGPAVLGDFRMTFDFASLVSKLFDK